MITYEGIIIGSWIAFLLVWSVSALHVKRDIRGGHSDLWRLYWLFRIVVIVFLAFAVIRTRLDGGHYVVSGPVFSHALFVPSLFLGWIAAVLSAAGIGIAIWARFHLGRNWSPRPAVKEDRELVTGGPYVYVRHPIYTGLILTSFGTFAPE